MAVFYLPLDVPAFVAANPGFEALSAPAAHGLTFDPTCQSCAEPPDHLAQIVTGTRLGARAESFEQPVYLCQDCLADQSRTRHRVLAARAARVVVAVVVATVGSTAARGLGMSGIAATATWLLLLPATNAINFER